MTALVTWSPLRELGLMERRMRKLLDETDWTVGALPAADVYETPSEFVVKLDVPGFEEKELSVEVTDHTLVVRGEVEKATEQEEKTFHLRERIEKHFERTFFLPAETDTEHVEASFGKGVLEVHAPKLGKPEARKVEIGTGA